jgi:hypothetical protein
MVEITIGMVALHAMYAANGKAHTPAIISVAAGA